MTLLFLPVSQLGLEITSDNLEQSWQESQCFQNSSSIWRSYIHRLCLKTFITYLEEEHSFDANIWQANRLASFWEVVNGVAINLPNKRLVLLPTEAIDDDELRIPQEWIDIPEWAGDYYLAVQVNVDEQWLRIWGYTTHQQIKEEGSYDSGDRSYCLDGEQLIQDLNVLWLSQEFCAEETTQAEIAPLDSLPEVQAQNLLERLGNPDVTFPRLSIPFSLWGALLENDNWRQELYQLRQGIIPVSRVLVNLSRWWDNVWESVDNGWQSAANVNLGYRNRSATRDKSKVEGVKFIDLPGKRVALLIKLTKIEPNNRISVLIQLYAAQENNEYLPNNVKLVLLSEAGDKLAEVEAQDKDTLIQKSFKCNIDFRFQVQVALDDFSITEKFVA